MPASFGLGGRRSSRRFADASNASFSFQIPTASLGDEYLLEYDEDFFKGAEDILATPAPSSRSTLEPLSINDLAPRPSTRTSLKSTPQKILSRSPATASQRTPTRKSSRLQHGKTNPNSLTPLTEDSSIPQSPAGERIESLRTQVNLLTGDFADVQQFLQRESPKAPVILKKHNLRRREAAIQRKDPAKHTAVLNGGITKARQQRVVKRSLTAPNTPAELTQHALESQKVLPGQLEPDPEDIINPDSSVGPGHAPGVVAGSPLIQNMNHPATHGPVDALDDHETAFDHLNQNDLGASKMPIQPILGSVIHDTPQLTLSQLSPQKGAPRKPSFVDEDNILAIEDASEENLRTSYKRPASVIECSDEIEGGRAQKKSKPDPAPRVKDRPPLQPRRRSLVVRKPIKRLSSSTSRLKSNLAANKGKGKGASSGVSGGGRSQNDRTWTAGLNAIRKVDNKEANVGGSTTSNQSQNCQESNLQNQDRRGKITSASSSSSLDPQTSTSGRAHARLNTNATSGSGPKGSRLNIVRATIPVDFKFRTNARLEARKGAVSEAPIDESTETNGKDGAARPSLRQPRQPHRQLRNTKSSAKLRQESAISEQRRGGASSQSRVHRPVIPVPMHFETETRIKERHKFNVRMKEKEKREQEEREVQRKLREEEEERETREFRKRAVPKAHEVPEWYKEAPKRDR